MRDRTGVDWCPRQLGVDGLWSRVLGSAGADPLEAGRVERIDVVGCMGHGWFLSVDCWWLKSSRMSSPLDLGVEMHYGRVEGVSEANAHRRGNSASRRRGNRRGSCRRRRRSRRLSAFWQRIARSWLLSVMLASVRLVGLGDDGRRLFQRVGKWRVRHSAGQSSSACSSQDSEAAPATRGGFLQPLGLEVDGDGLLELVVPGHVDQGGQVFAVAILGVFGIGRRPVGGDSGRLLPACRPSMPGKYSRISR